MAMGTVSVGAPVNLTSSAQVAGGAAMARTFAGGPNDAASVAETTALQGAILGWYVNSTTSGTIALSKGTASGGAAITGTITPAIGWHAFPCVSESGIYCTIGSTINVTFLVVE
jgi:hypothetical protein